MQQNNDLVAEGEDSLTLTKRPVAPGAEAHLGVVYPILDHGMIRLVDYMGDDAAICQAARTSYGKGTKSVSQDDGLIRYLMRNWHTTPFEMAEIKLHVKLPVFVARQWIRHRTASVNEYSARYSILDREFYIPEPEHLAAQSAVNNQGRGAVLQGEEAARVLEILKTDAGRAYDNYEAMMSTEGQQGLARELARMNLPANIYTQFFWKCNLHNLYNFLRLRADSHAQFEIRVYAEQIAKITKDWVPMSYRAFEDYRLEGVQLSKMELELLRDMLRPSPENLTSLMTGWPTLDMEKSRMSEREMTEFRKKLGL